MNIIQVFYEAWKAWALSASWQICLLVVLVALLAFVTRKLSPRWRYALWLLVIVKVFIPPSLGIMWGVGNWGIVPIRNQAHFIIQKRFQSEKPVQAVLPGEQPQNKSASKTTPLSQENSIVPGTHAPSSQIEQQTASSLKQGGFVTITGILFLGWLLGLLVLVSFVLFRYIRLSRILKQAGIIDEGPLRVELERLSLMLGKENPPDIVLSDQVSSPFLFGIFHPRIVLPANLPESLSMDEIRHVLLHELVHWKRKDLFVGWLQVASQLVFWFHPFVWLANQRVRHERECACDEAAVSLGKLPPKKYGEALLKVLLAAKGRSSVSLGFLGIFERNTRLQNRLEEIMNYTSSPRKFGVLSWVCVALFALIFLPMASVQSSKAGESTPQETKKSTDIQILGYVDDTAEEKRSLGASGHAVQFFSDRSPRFVEAVDIFAARYGSPEPPEEDFHLYVLNDNFQVLADLKYPYSMVERSDLEWYTLQTPSIEVPQQFFIALSFNPHKTKGIYLGLDQGVSESHSFQGLPRSGYKEITESQDWMIRVHLSDSPTNTNDVRFLSDWHPPEKKNPFDGLIEVLYDNGVSEGKQSYGGRCPGFKIFPTDSGIGGSNILVKGFRIFAGRYGSGYIPENTFITLTIMDSQNQVLYTGKYPYSKFGYKPEWIDLPLKSPVVLETGEPWILAAFDPEAHKTKGIYFHYISDPGVCHSYVGKVGSEFQEVPDREWMVRTFVEPTDASPTKPLEHFQDANQSPRLVSSIPKKESSDVDPSIHEITVTFDRDMDTGGYSFTGGGANFPPIPQGEKPYWIDNRTCSLPVALKPGTYYRLGINSTSFKNFKSKNGIPAKPTVIYFTTSGSDTPEADKMEKPVIIDMYPENGQTNVNPGIREIIVTFNIPMGEGYSWTGGGLEFPKIIEGMTAYWTNQNKTCVLPVELKPDWNYRLGLNSPSHKNFQSAQGIPLDPVRYSFTTGSAE